MGRNEWEASFEKRFERHKNELARLYHDLYRNNTDGFDRFCSMLGEYYEARGAALRRWDKKQLEEDADWYRRNDVLGMQMYVSCFADDLKGCASKIEYLKETGVKMVHLMPLLETPEDNSDGGYAVSDFRKVQPELGTMKDLEALAAKLHRNGIRLCLDLILNHTSNEHEWALRARRGEREYMNRYYFFDDWTVPNQFEKTKPQIFPGTAPGNFTWNDETHRVVMTTFYPYQWDLNYWNPAVFHEMTANMLNLCNHGADVIRLDALPYIWKEIGTDCFDLPQVHTIVRILRIVTEIVCPGTLLLGETVMTAERALTYFGSEEQPECHLLFNNTAAMSLWNTVGTGDVRLLQHQLAKLFSFSREHVFLNHLRGHDDISWDLDFFFLKGMGMDEIPHREYLNTWFTGRMPGSDSRGELTQNDLILENAGISGTTASLCGIEAAVYERDDYKLQKYLNLDVTLHCLLLSAFGLPVIYSGDEIGQLNDYDYRRDPKKKYDSRNLQRGKMNRDHLAMRHDFTTRQGQMYSRFIQMVRIRREHEVFDSRASLWTLETWNDHVLGIGRYYHGEKLLAFFNFSPSEEIAWINEEETYWDPINGREVIAKGVIVPPYGYRWLMRSGY